jgi:putative oxidoreductase
VYSKNRRSLFKGLWLISFYLWGGILFAYVSDFRTKYNDVAYAIFRVLVGLFFVLHGAQKLFGILGGSAQPLVSLMGIAGIIEFVGGILIALGLFTVPVAIVTALEMLVAYVMAHAPKGALPIANGGELALLFFAAFFYIIFEGSGRYSLDAWWCRRREATEPVKAPVTAKKKQ